MFKSLLPSDPTGEMLHIVEQWSVHPHRISDGVWASPDGARALHGRANCCRGSDIDAQERRSRARFGPPSAAVSNRRRSTRPRCNALSGPGVFAVAARAKIEHAAVRCPLIGSLIVVSLLFAVYRSVTALALGLLPVATAR